MSGQRLQLMCCAGLLSRSRYFELYAGICAPQGLEGSRRVEGTTEIVFWVRASQEQGGSRVEQLL